MKKNKKLTLLAGLIVSSFAQVGFAETSKPMEFLGTCEFLPIENSCTHSRGVWHRINGPTDNCQAKTACCITDIPKSVCESASFGPSTPNVRRYAG